MKKLTPIIIMFLFTNLMFAQEREESEDLTHSLGMMAGATTGFGFSYRYLPNKIGFQVTAIPIFRGEGELYSSTGLSLLYRVRSHEKLDVFAYFGNHLIYSSYQDYYYDYQEGMLVEASHFNYSVGLGAGVNIHLWDVLDLSVKVGYGLYDLTMSPITSLAGGLGLYYRF